MKAEYNNQQLKKVIKESLIEVLDERRDLLHEALSEIIEDIALSKAIKEGSNRRVSRKRIDALLAKGNAA
jgi:hypothetical protein